MVRLVVLCFFSCSYLLAQDTIQVSKQYKTILVFPMDIVEATGGKDVLFEYRIGDRSSSKYGSRLVKLTYNLAGDESPTYSNFTVITDSGNLYEYILTNVSKPKVLTWVIDPKSATVNIEGKKIVFEEERISENRANQKEETKVDVNAGFRDAALPEDEDMVKEKELTAELYNIDKVKYIRTRCYYHQFDKAKLIRRFNQVDDVFLKLKAVYYDKNELYFAFVVKNDGVIDYDIDFINFSITTNYKKSSSNQDRQIDPIVRYKIPKRVKGKTENHFFAVFDKFTLNNKKILKVSLEELKGSRNVDFEIPYQLISKAITF